MYKLQPNKSIFTTIYSGDLPAGNFLFIYGDTENGWYIANRNESSTNIYFSKNLENGKWILVKADICGSNIFDTNDIWHWKTDSGFAYATANNGIHFFNFSSKSWIERKTPDNWKIIALELGFNNSIGIVTTFAGYNGPLGSIHISTDNAKNWKKVQSPRQFKSRAPILTRNNTILMADNFNQSLLSTNDYGENWEIISEFTEHAKLYTLPSGKLLAINDDNYTDFAIKLSEDEGITWSIEHSNTKPPLLFKN